MAPSRQLQPSWLSTLGFSSPLLPWPELLVDPDTPSEAQYTLRSGTSQLYRLVMSDEFEVDGRRFGESERDPRWTAVSRHDPTNGNMAYMTPAMATTRGGALEIRTTNTGFRASMYASASVQSWDKVCVQGGIIEVSFTLPGAPGRPGVWPAIWMLGNLGRATYPLSTDGLWPFSYREWNAGEVRHRHTLCRIATCAPQDSLTTPSAPVLRLVDVFLPYHRDLFIARVPRTIAALSYDLTTPVVCPRLTFSKHGHAPTLPPRLTGRSSP